MSIICNGGSGGNNESSNGNGGTVSTYGGLNRSSPQVRVSPQPTGHHTLEGPFKPDTIISGFEAFSISRANTPGSSFSASPLDGYLVSQLGGAAAAAAAANRPLGFPYGTPLLDEDSVGSAASVGALHHPLLASNLMGGFGGLSRPGSSLRNTLSPLPLGSLGPSPVPGGPTLPVLGSSTISSSSSSLIGPSLGLTSGTNTPLAFSPASQAALGLGSAAAAAAGFSGLGSSPIPSLSLDSRSGSSFGLHSGTGLGLDSRSGSSLGLEFNSLSQLGAGSLNGLGVMVGHHSPLSALSAAPVAHSTIHQQANNSQSNQVPPPAHTLQPPAAHQNRQSMSPGSVCSHSQTGSGCGSPEPLAAKLKRRLKASGGNGNSAHSSRPTCMECGKDFSNQSALSKHKLTHSDERKFACHLCGKAFKRQDHLNGHLLTHREKKPFQCDVQGCDKTYCDARSLKRHKENHHALLCQLTGGIGLAAGLAPEVVAQLAAQLSGPLQSNQSTDHNNNSGMSNASSDPADRAAVEQLLQQLAGQEKAGAILQQLLAKDPAGLESVAQLAQLSSWAQQQARQAEEQFQVECPVCQKKFKNLPALNGHMRLHGGYLRGAQVAEESGRTQNQLHSSSESRSALGSTSSGPLDLIKRDLPDQDDPVFDSEPLQDNSKLSEQQSFAEERLSEVTVQQLNHLLETRTDETDSSMTDTNGWSCAEQQMRLQQLRQQLQQQFQPNNNINMSNPPMLVSAFKQLQNDQKPVLNLDVCADNSYVSNNSANLSYSVPIEQTTFVQNSKQTVSLEPMSPMPQSPMPPHTPIQMNASSSSGPVFDFNRRKMQRAASESSSSHHHYLSTIPEGDAVGQQSNTGNAFDYENFSSSSTYQQQSTQQSFASPQQHHPQLPQTRPLHSQTLHHHQQHNHPQPSLPPTSQSNHNGGQFQSHSVPSTPTMHSHSKHFFAHSPAPTANGYAQPVHGGCGNAAMLAGPPSAPSLSVQQHSLPCTPTQQNTFTFSANQVQHYHQQMQQQPPSIQPNGQPLHGDNYNGQGYIAASPATPLTPHPHYSYSMDTGNTVSGNASTVQNQQQMYEPMQYTDSCTTTDNHPGNLGNNSETQETFDDFDMEFMEQMPTKQEDQQETQSVFTFSQPYAQNAPNVNNSNVNNTEFLRNDSTASVSGYTQPMEIGGNNEQMLNRSNSTATDLLNDCNVQSVQHPTYTRMTLRSCSPTLVIATPDATSQDHGDRFLHFANGPSSTTSNNSNNRNQGGMNNNVRNNGAVVRNNGLAGDLCADVGELEDDDDDDVFLSPAVISPMPASKSRLIKHPQHGFAGERMNPRLVDNSVAVAATLASCIQAPEETKARVGLAPLNNNSNNSANNGIRRVASLFPQSSHNAQQQQNLSAGTMQQTSPAHISEKQPHLTTSLAHTQTQRLSSSSSFSESPMELQQAEQQSEQSSPVCLNNNIQTVRSSSNVSQSVTASGQQQQHMLPSSSSSSSPSSSSSSSSTIMNNRQMHMTPVLESKQVHSRQSESNGGNKRNKPRPQPIFIPPHVNACGRLNQNSQLSTSTVLKNGQHWPSPDHYKLGTSTQQSPQQQQLNTNAQIHQTPLVLSSSASHPASCFNSKYNSLSNTSPSPIGS